jgi:hypothetical protein
MNAAITKRIVNNYLRYMRNWDNETKKDLIRKLTASIDSKSKDKYDFSSCFGAWEDDRSAEEIVNDLRADRVNKDEIERF